jgi:hypothetical protein
LALHPVRFFSTATLHFFSIDLSQRFARVPFNLRAQAKDLLLTGVDIVTLFKQVGGKTVAKAVTADVFLDTNEIGRLFDRPIQRS